LQDWVDHENASAETALAEFRELASDIEKARVDGYTEMELSRDRGEQLCRDYVALQPLMRPGKGPAAGSGGASVTPFDRCKLAESAMREHVDLNNGKKTLRGCYNANEPLDLQGVRLRDSQPGSLLGSEGVIPGSRADECRKRRDSLKCSGYMRVGRMNVLAKQDMFRKMCLEKLDLKIEPQFYSEKERNRRRRDGGTLGGIGALL